MGQGIVICELFQWILFIGGILVSLISLVVSVGYWFKPLFGVDMEPISNTSTQIRVTITNNNLFCNSIIDIYCEFTLSEEKDFSKTVRTMYLIKDKMVRLKKKPAFYVFKANISSEPENDITGMKYIRVRLLAPNFIGVKKVKEIIFKISN